MPATMGDPGYSKAHASAAVRAAARVSSGPDVPKHFLWLSDISGLVSAFFLAHMAAPILKAFAMSQGGTFKPFLDALSPEGGEYRPISEVAWVLMVMLTVTALGLQVLGGYRPLLRQSYSRIVLSACVPPMIGLSTVALILFTLKGTSWSRLFIFLFTAFSAAFLCAYRLFFRWYRVKRLASGFHTKSVLFVGPTPVLEWLSGYFAASVPNEYSVVGYLRMAPDQSEPVSGSAPTAKQSLPCLGDVDDLAQLVVHRPIHEVVAVAGSNGDWLREMIDVCDYFRVTLRIVPEALFSGNLSELQFIYRADPLRLPEVVLSPPDLDSDALFVKRLIDFVVSAVLLILLSPLFLLIAIILKLTTPGLPVFYRWQVVGYHGKRFTGYKFSTMLADADQRKTELMSKNEMEGPVFKIKDDPRVTSFGRFLRKYSLNELPQLWSVLKGDMSLVGPRPAFPHELERYELWHKRKLCVRPGITCLWQVRGRNRISRFDDWVSMDLEYIDHWSLWLDFKILARTVWVVVAGTGS